MSETYTFKAEIKQLLDILVHSLYTEREIFLRELISNASDALNRVQFEMLTNRDILDADAELRVEVLSDPDTNTLTIRDTGIGMTRDDLVENIGVIAHSGARAFIDAMKDKPENATAADVIGQFGVGFYSVFMAADKVRIHTRSHHEDGQAWVWESDGSDNYTIEAGDRSERGTDITIYLKEDATEFAQQYRLREIISRHSDFVAFPIYLGEPQVDEESGEVQEQHPVNKQKAIWRQSKSDIEDEDYNNFYQQMTLDFQPPLKRIHMKADVPLQFYALLFVPASTERTMFSLRKEPGLKLYARKVLIQEYNTDLLPEYLQFVQGVVDSEDLPLNVSRESVAANRVIATLKKTLTNKVLSELGRMANKDFEAYRQVYEAHGRMIKQGVAVTPQDRESIMPLLYFPSTAGENADHLTSLADYVGRMAEGQEDIYYIIGDDYHSAARSPHLDAFQQRGIEVLFFVDPIDPIMVMGLDEFDGHALRSIDDASIDLSELGDVAEDDETEAQEAVPEADFNDVIERFQTVLGDRVSGVQVSKSLVTSPARLVSDEDTPDNHMFRINRLFDRDYELPVKKLELNPRHPLLHNLSNMVHGDGDNPLVNTVIEQVFETALLQDGIHPDPASMAARLHELMRAATDRE